MAEINQILNRVAAALGDLREPQYRGPSMNFYQQSGGQLQFSTAGPKYRSPEKTDANDPGIAWSSKAGAVFIEAAPPDPNNKERLDWANSKIVFAMSDKDIGEIIWGLKTNAADIRLVHAPEGADAKNNNKTFRLKREADWNGQPQWSMSLIEKRNADQKKVSIFVRGPDIIRLQLLLETSLPIIMGVHKA